MGFYRFIGKKENNQVFLTDEELKHAKVRHIKVGEKIEVNTLDGNVYLAEVEEITKKYLKAKVLESIKQEKSDIYLELFLSVPNKLSKIDDLIEPISELGVTKLIPVISEYSAVKEKQILKKIDKWKKIALNSIKQCKRLYPIEIENPIKIEKIDTNTEIRFVFYERERNRTLKDFINQKYKTISIYIGNEGGISDRDLKILKEKNFIPLSLSKNILRMETAVLTAICQVLFTFGDR
jgi:16S rRNA (uracil1498-N3)-methyltransferase